jgi:hypothetical protein
VSRFHHGREDVRPAADQGRSAHAETDAPCAMVDRLLDFIGAKFYAKKPAKTWLQDQRALMEVLTWPAVWCNQRAIGLPVADYEAKMHEILGIMAEHGDLGKVRHFPAYFLDCVRKHFAHHGEEIYEARKHVRNALDLAWLKGTAVAQKPADVVPRLMDVRAMLALARKRTKKDRSDDSQPSLF